MPPRSLRVIGGLIACWKQPLRVRGENPFVFTNLKTDDGLDEVVEWFHREILMTDLAGEPV